MDSTAVNDGRLYVGSGPRVIVYDASKAGKPRRVGISDSLPSVVEGLAASGELLAVAVGAEGLTLMDVSIPDQPEVVGAIPLPGYAEGVELLGGRAYVADGPGGLRIVDVSVPSAPVEVGVAYDLHQIFGVALVGTHAFLAAADEGLLVVGIADPGAPVELGGLHTGGYAFGIDVRGGTVYLADGWRGLRVISVDDPGDPRLLGTLGMHAWAMHATVRSNRTYVAAGADGLVVVDVARRARPKKLGALKLPRGRASHVALHRSFAYLSDIHEGLHVVDVARSRHPVRVKLIAPVGDGHGIDVAGDHAFLAAGSSGLRVFDVSDPANPREAESFATKGDLARGAAVVRKNAFLTTDPGPGSRYGNALIIGLDATDPTDLDATSPRDIIGGAALGLDVQGALLYLAIETQMVAIIDGRRPRPCLISLLRKPPDFFPETGAGGVSVAGDLAYVAAGGDIFVVDVTPPRQPRILTRVEFGGAEDLLAAGDGLYVLAGGTLWAFDITDRIHPQPRGFVQLQSGAVNFGWATRPLAYAGGKVFVAAGTGGLVVVDVSDPGSPQIAGRIRLSGPAVAVEADDRYAYVATGGVGLSVVEWTIPPITARMTAGGRAATVSAPHSDAAPRRVSATTAECRVTRVADSGPGSLRACLAGAEWGTLVTFDRRVFRESQPATIRPKSLLPALQGVKIDATGAGVALDGGGSVRVGLTLWTGNTVKNVRIRNFNHGIEVNGRRNTIRDNLVSRNRGAGIVFATGVSGNRVAGNLIGTNAAGMASAGFQGGGLSVQGTTTSARWFPNVIGGTRPRDRNVISGNQRNLDVGGSGNTVIGNYIGTDISGTRAVAPVKPDDPDRVALGVAGPGNTIKGNLFGGRVEFTDAASYTSFVGNRVGIDPTGAPFPCPDCGVDSASPFNRIGGSRPGEGNLIHGEDGGASNTLGIGAPDTVVLGNVVDSTGESAVTFGAGGLPGADIEHHSFVGGRSPDGGNVVTGDFGLEIGEGTESNFVIGNEIAATAVGARIGAGRSFLIANDIVAPMGTGILLDSGAYGNVIRGNSVAESEWVIRALVSEGNVIALNAFLVSPVNAEDHGMGNFWDDGMLGNFWADYGGVDGDGDGIGDTPRDVLPNGVDRFPLMEPP